jgi:hypothetical protein
MFWGKHPEPDRGGKSGLQRDRARTLRVAIFAPLCLSLASGLPLAAS